MNGRSTPLLALRKVSKRYGSLLANDCIDLSVMPGTIQAVLGENGAGKSTLMKLAYGAIQPDSGDILWQGQTKTQWNTAIARRAGVGMLFQHFSLFETLSVVDNIALTVPGSRQHLLARINEVAASYQLTIEPTALVHSLSVGERQRVEIIRCLLQELKLLILDEPTSVLPPQHVRALFAALRRLQESGVAILYISHKLDEIRELCDTATVLRNGRVTGQVDPNRTTAHELAVLMTGERIPALLASKDVTPSQQPKLTISGLTAASAEPFGTDLHDVNLAVYGGEIVGIAGISGNGQQELGRLISGEHIHSDLPAEAIQLLGQAAAQMGARQRRQLGFAYVPEERLGRGTVPAMTLAKNTLLTAFTKNLLRWGFIQQQAVEDYTQRCIADFNVKCAGYGATANSLSGGNLQKFLVGRELMLQPQILFLSQPTWGVDIVSANAIRQRLIGLRDRGIAVLIISEELDELFEITDRIYVLRSGQLSPSLATAELTPDHIGAYMMGSVGPSQDTALPGHTHVV